MTKVENIRGSTNRSVFSILNDEKQEEPEEHIISVPWENDNFSLNLETTFSSPHILKRITKQYVPPQTSSPLRNQWRVSQENRHTSKLMDFDVNEEIPDVLLLQKEMDQEQSEINKNSRKMPRKKNRPDIAVATDLFPYSNSSNLFAGSIKTESLRSPTPSISSRSRVEHVSPLINSPILQFNDIKPSSSISKQGYLPESQISAESWKIRSRSPGNTYYSDTPSIASSHHDVYRTGSPSVASSYRERYPSVEAITPSIASSSKDSYRSIAVPQNADNLVIFASDASIYASDASTRPYSHYFNPTLTHLQPKKRSPSLLRKLMNNIKHRFIATK